MIQLNIGDMPATDTPLEKSNHPVFLSDELARCFSQISESLKDLALPRVDFSALVSEQLKSAKELKERYLPPQSLRERVISALEGPWAPEASDLPERVGLPTPKGSRDPFRDSPVTLHSSSLRRTIQKFVTSAEHRWSLTPWSSVYEYDVPIRNLPRALQGLTILHLSDIHFLDASDRSWNEMSQIAKYFEKGAHRIDLILLSGDVITKSPDDLCKNSLRQLARLSAVCPQAFMVHGNHDYHGHVPAVISKQLEKVGFHDINNHHIRLRIGDAPLNIFGVDDAYFGNPVPPDSVPPLETNIVLTHNLDAIRGNFPKDVDLILSGHTHWGELKLFDGARVMNWWGYSDNINQHTKAWDCLTDRTLSYVHPGLARYYVPYRGLRHPPGIAIHTLVNPDTQDVH